jgi:ferredoxin-type protein NapF
MSDKDNNISRRGLLRGDWFKAIRKRGAEAHESESEFQIKTPEGQAKRGNSIIHRPPHAVAESEFIAGCTRCDACIEACDPHAIFRAPESEGNIAGTPIIDASGQPCIMCEDMPCVAACEAGVLRIDAPVAMALAEINTDTCLAYHGTVCTACVDQCPVENCMTMEGGRPKIDSETCTGCGVCLYVCPAPGGAIDLLPK